MNLTPATRPTFYFIGVTTGKSSIMTVFPKWAEYRGLGDVEVKASTSSRMTRWKTTARRWRF